MQICNKYADVVYGIISFSTMVEVLNYLTSVYVDYDLFVISSVVSNSALHVKSTSY